MADPQLYCFPLPNLFISKTILRFLDKPLLNAAIFVLLGSLFVVIYLIAHEFGLRKAKWPPGPRRLPILGNLHQLKSHLHVSLTELAKTYGPVMTVWMGNTPAVVVSGQDAAWDALVTQGSNFASRFQSYSRRLVTHGNRTMSSSEYGPRWSKLRRILQNSVVSPSHLASQSSSHGRDVGVLMARLVEEMNANNGIVKPLHHLKLMAVSFISSLCFGSQFHDPNFVHKMEDLVAQDINMAPDVQLLDTLPFTRFFVPSSAAVLKRYKALQCDIMELLSPLIQMYRTRRSMNENAAASNSFLDGMLSIQAGDEKDNVDSEFSDRIIAFNLYELFFLAVDSTSTTLEWALAYCMKHPEIQRKAYEEVKQAVPRERDVISEDLPKLLYLQAIVKETLRKAGVAPLAIPHQTINDCRVGGFHIPARTEVIFNLHAISNDGAIWSEADTFKPERFLSEEVKASKFAFLPFGAGRRICGGMEVANLHLPITLANMLKKFEWSCVKEGELADMEEKPLVFLRVMKHSLQARIKPRH